MKLDKYLGKGTKQDEGLSEKKANLGTAAGNQEDFLVVVAFKWALEDGFYMIGVDGMVWGISGGGENSINKWSKLRNVGTLRDVGDEGSLGLIKY